MYFDITNDVCASTNATVTLEISYLDEGTNPLVITYTNGVEDIYDLATREDATYQIAKTGSGSKKTVTVTLENINANNIGKFRSDFNITCADGAYISGINASSVAPGRELYTDGMIYAMATTAGTEKHSGMYVLGSNPDESYNARLWSVSDTQGWQSDGITQTTVDSANSSGYKYVTLSSDGAWTYKNISDKTGNTKPAFYAPKNYRQGGGSYYKISGAIYLKLTSDSPITASDNNVTFAITHLDGAGMKVAYTSTNADKGRSDFTITGGSTNKWKTTYVTVNDAKLSATNSGTGLATGYEDIKIESKGDEMSIASVYIYKTGSAAQSDVYIQNMYYEGRDAVKVGKSVTASADNNVTGNGLVATEKANSSYDNTLVSVDDKTAYEAAGFTSSDATSAKNAGCSYMSVSGVDGSWKYQEFTDKNGVTKNAFYSPKNWRKKDGAVNTNVYFRLTDDTIVGDDSDLVIAIEYLDKGSIMELNYVAWAGHTRTYIPITFTNTWKTAYISIDDARFSSSNSGTALASGVEDIKITTNETPIASITVMKKYDGDKDGEYEVIGSAVQNSFVTTGDVVVPGAVVTNKSNIDLKANLYKVIYNSDKTVKSIEKSSAVSVNAGGSADVKVSQTELLEGETMDLFVWDGTLTPVEKYMDPIDVVITPVDGSVKLSWNSALFAGYFINVYSRGELVGRTNGTYCILDNLKKGDNTIVVDVADAYGRVVFRSRAIVANVK